MDGHSGLIKFSGGYMVQEKRPPMSFGEDEDLEETSKSTRSPRGKKARKPKIVHEQGALSYIGSPVKEEDEEDEDLEEGEVNLEENAKEALEGDSKEDLENTKGKNSLKPQKGFSSKVKVGLDDKTIITLVIVCFLSSLLAFILVTQLLVLPVLNAILDNLITIERSL